MYKMDYYRINELPETYKLYKARTTDFEKWMLKVAKKRRLEIAEQAEVYAKQAACNQKKNSRSKPYHIPYSYMVPMAEAITKSGAPDEDVAGLADLKDAIRLRKEVNQW